jgi:copper resistance protein C
MFDIMKALACALFVLAFTVARAEAHAFLDHADPPVGSSLSNPPNEVRMWFTQELEPAFSTVQIFNERGQRVDKGENGVDARDHVLLRVHTAALAPGTYKVVWRVVSIDTHVSEGDFTFRVGP